MIKLFYILMIICGMRECASSNRDQSNSPLIPRKILFDNPEKLSPMISPDGKQLAYLAPDKNDVLNVWLKDLTGTGEDQLVTSDKQRGIRSFFWSYSGKDILYIQDIDGDENWHLYQTNLQTKKTRDLTPFKGIQTKLLAYEPQFPNDIIVGLNVRNPALFDVYRINIESGSVDLEVENNDNIQQWITDNKLCVRASSSYNQAGETIIRVRDDNHSPWRELIHWGAEENGHLLSFSPDDLSLYLFSTLDANTARLIEVNLSNGSKTTLAEDTQYDFLGLLGPEVMLNKNSHNIDAIGVMRERLEWIVLDPKIKQDFAILNKSKESLKIISRDLSDQHWIIEYSSDLHSPHFYLYNRETKENHFLFSSNPKLDRYQLTQVQF